MAERLLHTAKLQKNDEFYTQLPEIENELKHYKDQFRGKVVFCNCDDPYESNFFKYFANNFNFLGLKKLIATSYTKSPIAGTQLSLLEVEGLKPDGKQPFKVEINEVLDSDSSGSVDLSDVKFLLKHDKNTATPLKGDGDFRSEECMDLLKEADIVVTNPPFSLFREYVAQLMKYNKKFLIMGNQNAITYREIFKYIKENRMWLGQSLNGRNILFEIPEHYKSYHKIIDGKKYAYPKGVVWFTNLDVPKRNEEIVLYKKYSTDEYSSYENFEAINVDRTENIPVDYVGAMGVPITFLHKHNPNQFEIIGLGISNSGIEIGVKPYKPDHKKYRKEVQKRGTVDGDLYMVKKGIVDVPYARILIKNRKAEA
ncbi:MAG: adenine-specific methyltransferase EcoRI family protein [bacterium]|nr:adenine-specific methyltransferase EcoRI family protein [bacterium]